MTVRRGRPARPAESAPGAWTEEDWRMEFEERAAIMEFDGGLPCEQAEAAARARIDEVRRRGEQGRLF